MADIFGVKQRLRQLETIASSGSASSGSAEDKKYNIHEDHTKTGCEQLKPAPVVADKRFLHYQSMTIRQFPSKRVAWTPTEWTIPQTFCCDCCDRTVTRYRVSTKSKTGKLSGSYCSFTCERFASWTKRGVNLDDYCPIQTRFYMETYNYKKPIPLIPDPLRLPHFHTGSIGRVSYEEFEAATVYAPAPKVTTFVFAYEPILFSISLYKWPGANEQTMKIIHQNHHEQPQAASSSSSSTIPTFEGLEQFYQKTKDDPVHNGHL